MATNSRITNPSIMIDGTEFKCNVQSLEVVPGDFVSYCTQEWTATMTLIQNFGVDGSFNLLDAMRDTKVQIVASPTDGVASEDSPTITFMGTIPAIPFTLGERNEIVEFDLEIEIDGEPVIDYGGV